jgi:hypothetical protein
MDKYRQYTIAAVLLLFLICLCMFWSEAEPWRSFGEHGLVEVVAMGVAVFVIDRLQKRREDLRMLPRRLVAHEDVRSAVQHIVNFWMTAYVKSVPEPLPTTANELMTEQIIRLKIGVNLWMDSEPAVTPARKWWDWLPQQLAESKRRVEEALARNNAVLEPEVFQMLHKLVRSFGETDMSTTMRRSNAEFGLPRPELLANFFFVSDEYYSATRELIAWSNAEAAKLEKALNVKVLRIDEHLTPVDGQKPPPNMMPDVVRVQQDAAYKLAAEQLEAKRASAQGR